MTTHVGEISLRLRLTQVVLLLVIACLFAGVYGAVHNQISYTVAPEYFTQFKFHQFHISDGIPPRLGAAVVGWLAAWWMGIILGGVLIPVGFILLGRDQFFRVMIRVFGVVAITAMAFGVAALAAAYWRIDPNSVRDITIYGNQVSDDAAFLRAGTMHNFSYLGGFVGIISGLATLFRHRKRASESALESRPTTSES